MLIRADNLAQRYGGRPSAFLGIDPAAAPLLAYQVDEAAALAGSLSSAHGHAADAPPVAASPARRAELRIIGGTPIVTGVVERE